MWFACRLGETAYRRKVHIATVILRDIILPQNLHSGDEFLSLSPAVVKVAAENRRFFPVPPCADAEQEPSAAGVVKRRYLLGGENRVALGNQTNTCAELEAAGRDGSPSQRH